MASGASTAAGAPFAIALVALSEAAVPIPVPSDALMLVVGERAADGAIPLWLAFVGLEVATAVGVCALYFAVRGPANSLVRRLGPRLGLTDERLARVSGVVERNGAWALAVGRAAPGFRTLSVVAGATSKVRRRTALLALFVGGSAFVQLHLFLGYILGPAALDLFHRAAPLALGLLVLALLGALIVLYQRRGRAGAGSAWAEAACPACLALGHLAERRMTGAVVVDTG